MRQPMKSARVSIGSDSLLARAGRFVGVWVGIVQDTVVARARRRMRMPLSGVDNGAISPSFPLFSAFLDSVDFSLEF